MGSPRCGRAGDRNRRPVTLDTTGRGVLMIAEPSDPPLDRKKEFETLVAAFGKAWESGDAKALARTFTENGTFLPDPFATPVHGRRHIEEYWSDIPKAQAEITFRWGEIYMAGPWFSVEVKCTFRRRRTGEWVDLRGALFCETQEQQFREMRMYYHRDIDR